MFIEPEEREDGDPPREKREWFRHSSDGQKGFLVEREGQKYIKLDRPNQEILKPLRNGDTDWIPLKEEFPVTPMQIAQVSYTADAALRRMLAQPPAKGWDMLSHSERMRWKKKGPPEGTRREMWRLITGLLSTLTKEE